MEFKNSCLCCLVRPPDRDLRTPYINLGSTEIYADMLKDCFEIHLQTPSEDESCGICEVCVRRLRYASNFKHQVQSSQAKLCAHLLENIHIKDVRSGMKLVTSDDDNDVELLIIYPEEKIEASQELLRNNENQMLNQYEPGTEEVEHKETLTKFRKKKQSVKRELDNDVRADQDNTTEALADKQNDTEEEVEYINPVIKCKTNIKSVKRELKNDVHANQDNTTEALAVNQETSCDSCGKDFKTRLNLANHMLRIHYVVNTYKCEVCHIEFKRFKQLVYHSRVHKGQKPFSCDICNKKYRETSSLLIHKRVHAGELPFRCEICNKQFTRKKCLVKHKRTHSDVAERRNYVCNECDKGFTLKSNLIAHIRIHTGEKPYECEVCKKRFNHQSSFKYHVRTHAKEKKLNFKLACKLCGKNFRSLSIFTNHERVHNGEKPYSCEECGKEFSRKDHLNRHMYLHTGFKRFCCEICGKQFRVKSNLTEHSAVHGLRERRRRGKRSRRGAPIPSGQACSTDQRNSTKRVGTRDKEKSI